MLAGLSTRQLLNWQAYYLLEPFGFPAAERRHADLCYASGKMSRREAGYKPDLKTAADKRRGLSYAEIRAINRSAGS